MSIFTANDAFHKQIFLEKVFRENLSSSFFMKFSGADVLGVNGATGHINPIADSTSSTLSVQGSPIVVQRDLSVGQGGGNIKMP